MTLTVAATPDAVRPNAEAIAAWDGPLYDRFVRFRHIVTTGLGAHGEHALRLDPPGPGQRVLDIGRGLGDSTQRIAGQIGPDGTVTGVDAAARFIGTVRQEAAKAGVANVRFEVADIQAGVPGGPYELAFPRSGRCSSPTRSPRSATCAASSHRWAARDGRLATACRERLDLPRADDRRAAH